MFLVSLEITIILKSNVKHKFDHLFNWHIFIMNMAISFLTGKYVKFYSDAVYISDDDDDDDDWTAFFQYKSIM